MFSLATKYWTNSRSATNYKSFFNSFNSPVILNRSPIVINPKFPKNFVENFVKNYRSSYMQQLIRGGRNVESRRKIESRDCLLRCLADKWPKKKKKKKKCPPSPIYTGVSRPSRIIKTLPPPCCASFHNPVVASSDKRHCSCEAAQPNNCLIDAAQLSWIAYLLHRLPFTLPCTSLTSPQLLFRREDAIRFPSNPSQSIRRQNYYSSWKTHPVSYIHARNSGRDVPIIHRYPISKLFISARRLVWNCSIEKLIWRTVEFLLCTRTLRKK